MPKLEVRRLRRMLWSIVSNAALREKMSGESIISCMVDRIKDVNERSFSRVIFSIS